MFHTLNLKNVDTIKKNQTAGQKKHYGPRLVGEILHDYLENSNEPLAAAYRDRLFKDLFPDTHPCIDLKVLTRQPEHMEIGDMILGTLVRSSEDQFALIENDAEKKQVKPVRRNPIVFEGGTVNVHRLADGTYRLEFARPRFFKDYTFRDFCLAAAQELLVVARLLGEEDSEA